MIGNKNFTDHFWEFQSVAFFLGELPYSIIIQNSKLTGCLPLLEVYPCTACTDRHQIHNIPRSSYNHCDTRSHRELGVDACQMDPQILHAESADKWIFFLKMTEKKTHIRLKFPYPNPWIGLFFWAGFGTDLSLEHRKKQNNMTVKGY